MFREVRNHSEIPGEMSSFVLTSLSLIVSDPYADVRDYSAQTILMAIATGSFFLGIYLYQFVISVFWDKGVFPPFFRGTKRRRRDAYMQLGVIIIRFEAAEFIPKLQLIRRFILKKYPNWNFDVLSSYKFVKANLVSTVSVCDWLLKRGIAQEERVELFNILFEMAVCDGQLGKSEYQELRFFCVKMGLSVVELDQKVEDFREAYFKAEQEKRKQAEQTGRATDYLKQERMRVLGLTTGFTVAELKKSYRIMVKSCHPDMTRSAHSEEKELLNQRFLEIQEAYEYLSKWV